jgi:hypothetical protein
MLMQQDEIDSPGGQQLLRDAEHVQTFNPKTGFGVQLDGQLRMMAGSHPGEPAHKITSVMIVAETPEQEERARASTVRAKGRMLHIDRQKEIAAGVNKLRAQAKPR